MKKMNFLLTLLFSLTLLVGCAGGEGKDSSSSSSSSSSTEVRTELTTEVTEATKLTRSYEGKTFTKDGIGEVKFERHVDGDTTWFNDGVKSFSLRYYGINTPESTAKIQPWGLAASAFTKERLHAAEKIVLERDTAKEETNGRILGLVWIKEKGKADFYCLNLLIVEQAFSTNQFFDAESKYINAFRQAGENAKATGKRVHGEKDPDFDYSNKAINVTVEEIYENFETYRKSGKKLVVHAVITRYIPDGFYIRSLEPVTLEDGTEKYSYIYCFTFGDTLGKNFKEGSAVKFYAKAGEFGGNPQLTDVVTSQLNSERPVLIDKETRTIDYVDIDETTKLEDYLYSPVKANLEITRVNAPSPNSGDVTVSCKFVGTSEKFDIRVPSQMIGYYQDIFVAGNKVSVKGILDKFTFDADKPEEFKYQLKICSKSGNELDATIIE